MPSVEYHLLLILIFLMKSGISQDLGKNYELGYQSTSFWRCFRGLS